MNSQQILGASLQFILKSATIVLIAVVGCGRGVDPAAQPAAAVHKVDVFVVNYPLAYFAERLGGELVDVTFPVPTEADPAFWEPDEDDVKRIQSADLVLVNGADYAKWTLRTSLPWSRTVVTTRDVEDQYIEVPNAVTHTHGPEGEHSHAGLASETWVDPQLAVSQAEVIKEELQKLLPDSSDAIQANFEDLKKDLHRVGKDLKAVFARSGLRWTASYPAYRYVGRRYDLKLQTMNWDPSELPSDEQWADFDKLLAGAESSLMLWPESPNAKMLDRLKSRGVRVVVFRLAANRRESGDYLTVMRQNLAGLKEAVAASPPGITTSK